MASWARGAMGGGLLFVVVACGGSSATGSSSSTAALPATTVEPPTSPAAATTSSVLTPGGTPDPTVASPTGSPTTTDTNPVPPLAPGEVPDGATVESVDGLAKVASVTERATARDARSAPAPGTSLTRVRVEQCAGATALAVDPLAWGGVLDDGESTNAVVGSTEPELRVAPFGCVAGDIDIVVPDGKRLVSVVLRNQALLERGRWRLNGPWVAPHEPLLPAQEAEATLPDVESVTSRGLAVTISELTLEGSTIGARVHTCATQQPVPLDPTRWVVLTSYHTVVAVKLVGSEPPKRIDVGGCVDFRVEATGPADEPLGHLVVVELKEEVARFALGG